MPDRLDYSQMALRVARELTSGGVVALGLGLPTLVPEVVSPGSGLLFVSESGTLGYQMQGDWALDSGGRPAGFIPGGVSVSTVELAAMVRAGYVDTVVLQPGQVTCQGDFTHWTTAATPGLFAASWASEYASGPERIIAMMPHTDHDGNPTIVSSGHNALGWPRLRERDCHRCGGDTGGPGRLDAGRGRTRMVVRRRSLYHRRAGDGIFFLEGR